ncbi:hypothetical protein TcasGA2_TC014068 [Tribolium castaneum]|uniref:MD-2-related lipid-recognition domain-containing protein n=2 Tax=Tribolium castaneum TaxID=7070 RepID=D6WK06_TRICA|nr:PREDICTED: uncharacterized protein LOC663437 [Tribolium castaneum]EFA04656.1 hypothetical protein TcasGA2_TC014068 [Tribolium castaneum]|eukprot:XP_974575.1 PREDICTED: uncharacterized protein LOC663437 [Tribolium castaneum]
MTNLFLPFLIIAVSCGSVICTNVLPCTSVDIPPPVVEIQNCEDMPCVFYLNTRTSMTMKFRAPRYLEHFAPQALAMVMGLNVTYPLGQDDGCDGVTNTPCPLAENEYVEYTYGMYLLPFFPEVTLSMEFSLFDKDLNSTFECFKIDVQITKA